MCKLDPKIVEYEGLILEVHFGTIELTKAVGTESPPMLLIENFTLVERFLMWCTK